MKINEIKKELEGCEVLSLSNEGTVYVKCGEAYRYGEKITVRSWRTLWKEYVEAEVGQ